MDPESVRACPKSRRLFEIQGLGFARVTFARDPLTAMQVVQLLEHLHGAGCAVPAVVPTMDGKLAVGLDDTVIAVETRLPGEECSGATLEVLGRAGLELARIHLAMSSFPTAPVENRSLAPWIDETMDRLLAVAEEHLPTVQRLKAVLRTEETALDVPWGLVHGDVRGANVLFDGKTLGFTDLNPKVLPLLRDVVMIRNKWLANCEGDRPLTVEEVADFVRGYSEVRNLTLSERTAFPLVWAVYQADRLLRDRRSIERASPERRARWPIADQLAALPGEIGRARQLLDLALSGLPVD